MAQWEGAPRRSWGHRLTEGGEGEDPAFSSPVPNVLYTSLCDDNTLATGNDAPTNTHLVFPKHAELITSTIGCRVQWITKICCFCI